MVSVVSVREREKVRSVVDIESEGDAHVQMNLLRR